MYDFLFAKSLPSLSMQIFSKYNWIFLVNAWYNDDAPEIFMASLIRREVI